MGNSGSGHPSYKNQPPQLNQYVQSLPREGRGRGSSTAAAQKYYNGGFKVLPERVPGQKLRLTDNGNLLQNGGTLSGRRLANEAPETDAEFAQLLKRRSDMVKGSPRESYDDSSIGHRKGDNGTMGKKYHSNPDLLNSHGIISGNPSGIQPSDPKKKKLLKKSKAPPPPQGYVEEDPMHPYAYEKEGHAPAKEKKRPFANFLKPTSKKPNEIRKPSSRQDFGAPGHHAADGPASGSPPSSSINAEITSAKLDSRDKSVTYVLERRDYHSSSSVLNSSKVQNQIPAEHPDRRYVKPPDSGKPAPGYHAQLKGKLSDGQAQTIDRAEIRNKAFEIQKRVRSMDSLACSSDEREIYHQQQQQQHASPLRNELQERFARQSREIKSLDNLQSVAHNGKGGLLGRQPSNSSSLLSDRIRERPPWDRRHHHGNEPGGPTRPMSMPYPREPDGHSNRDFLNRSDSSNRKAYYYGGPQRNQAMHSPNQNHHPKESFPGSLDRRENGDVKVHHQRTPSGSAMPAGPPRMPPEEQEARHRDHGENHDGGHRLSSLEINKNFSQSQYNRNLDQFSKDKLRPMNSKEIIVNTVREGDQGPAKAGKEYHEKDAVSEHLQDAFFAKTKETRAGVIEYNRKLASGRHFRESGPVKSSDGDLSSEDEMDINMQLRPTLPKRLQSMPRFSPQQVWRSFSLDDAGAVDKCSEHSSDGEEGDVFEDRILRVARPVAPPRSNNEKSADSGISPGAGSPGPVPYDFDAVVIPEKFPLASPPPPPPPPLPASKNHHQSPSVNRHQSSDFYPLEPISPFAAKDQNGGNGRAFHHQDHPSKNGEDKKPLWTPEEDLASDFDAGSGDHQAANVPAWTAPTREMISTQPKLISRKDMFVSKKSTNGSLLVDKEKFSDYSDAEGKSGKKSKGPKTGEPSSPQKYNSVRKLKRSLSGVLQGHVRVKSGDEVHTNLDDNWSLSRSLPNSLHNGHEGERVEKKQPTPQERSRQVADPAMGQQRLPRSESGPIYVAPKHHSELVERQPFTDLEGRAFCRERARAAIGAGARYNRNGHIVYLPKYEAMEIIEENMDPIGMERRAYSDLGMGTNTASNGNAHNFPFKKPKKFTYQSTVRQIERKQLEQKLSEVVAVKEKQRAREMDLVNKVEEEFQKKRDREKADIRQQLRILSLESNQNSQNEDLNNGYYESSRSLPREYPVYDDNNAAVDTRDKSAMNRNEHGHLSLPPLIIPPEDYDLTIPRNSGKLKLGSLPGRNSQDFAPQPSHMKAYGKSSQMGDSPQSSGFFSGIGKWMRRQQRLEKHGDLVPSRQEPEGAPSAFGPSSLPLHDGERLSPDRSSHGPSSTPSSPHHENRSNAIVGSKFSSGRMPDGQAFQPSMPQVSPQQRKNIYSHLAEVAEKEEHLRLKQQHGRSHGEKDARTSVWISPDSSYPPPSHAAAGHGGPNNRPYSDFYEVPYDSLGHAGNKLEANYGHNSRHDKLQSKNNEDMPDNYNRARHSAIKPEWNVGQRHSIAVEPSRDHWATGIIPPPRGFDEGRRQSRDSDFTSSNSYSTQNNGHGEHGWNRGVGRQDSYRESPEEDGYRRRPIDAMPLSAHHRSLSFSHINSEESSSNGRKPENASPRPAVPPVQPFHPNKAYRPVAFQTGNHGFQKCLLTNYPSMACAMVRKIFNCCNDKSDVITISVRRTEPKPGSSLPHIPAFVEPSRRISIYCESDIYREGVHWRKMKEQILGCGHFGVCYQALDVVTGTLMAVKQVPIIGLDAANAEELKDEIEVLGRMNHSNIVRILGATQESSYINIFLEWMPGGSVASLLAKFGAFHEYVIIRYTKQVLTGLAYLHANQLIHRDLKGANILVDGTGQHIRISDFGTVGYLKSPVTETGEFVGELIGTMPFMAPEVVKGANYGRASDIWSVGCVIIQMATARLPWECEGMNSYQLLYLIATTNIPPEIPTYLSNSTRSLTAKCLELNPKRRPTAESLLQQPVFYVSRSLPIHQINAQPVNQGVDNPEYTTMESSPSPSLQLPNSDDEDISDFDHQPDSFTREELDEIQRPEILEHNIVLDNNEHQGPESI